MSRVVTDNQHYADIARALREKSGGEETYLPSAMAQAVSALQTGGYQMETQTISDNPSYTTASVSCTAQTLSQIRGAILFSGSASSLSFGYASTDVPLVALVEGETYVVWYAGNGFQTSLGDASPVTVEGNTVTFSVPEVSNSLYFQAPILHILLWGD